MTWHDTVRTEWQKNYTVMTEWLKMTDWRMNDNDRVKTKWVTIGWLKMTTWQKWRLNDQRWHSDKCDDWMIKNVTEWLKMTPWQTWQPNDWKWHRDKCDWMNKNDTVRQCETYNHVNHSCKSFRNVSWSLCNRLFCMDQATACFAWTFKRRYLWSRIALFNR